MTGVISKLSRPSVFLVSEFVIIVLGVLVALAVDNWNESRRNDAIRAHLIASLLSDLTEDKADYAEFSEDSRNRAEAARFLLRYANGGQIDDTDLAPGEALYSLGRTSRLETVENTFREMTARGTGISIADSKLRLEISYYYGLARDRADINDLLVPGILRYREYLEQQGASYVDRGSADVARLLQQPHLLANIRELERWAEIAVILVTDIQEANQRLINRLELLHEAAD